MAVGGQSLFVGVYGVLCETVRSTAANLVNKLCMRRDVGRSESCLPVCLLPLTVNKKALVATQANRDRVSQKDTSRIKCFIVSLYDFDTLMGRISFKYTIVSVC